MSAGVPRFLRGPVPLSDDNFTPLTRTPWAGREIAARYKQHLPAAAGQRIGEAWEFSAEASFASHVRGGEGHGRTLADLVLAYPEAVLSPAHAGQGMSLLVKLLDAAEPLSLQVHPANHTPGLAHDEGGKPESWLVLAAAPGAGIYVGFNAPYTRDELRAMILGGRGQEAMHLELVRPGDYFEIAPGVPHAVGAGVTLLEPQWVAPGLIGKTYRLWDWDRRYDSAGRTVATGGEARPLHLEESLALVEPEQQVGAAFVQSLRRTTTPLYTSADVSFLAYPANDHYQTIVGRGAAESHGHVAVVDGFAALIVLKGKIVVGSGEERQVFQAGQPALLPHAAMPLTFYCPEACEFALVIPAGATLKAAQ